MSHYLRCLKIADILKEEFEFIFAHSDKYTNIINEHGLRTAPYQHNKVNEILEKAVQFEFDWINSESIKTMFNAQTILIKTFKPDIIMSDTMLSMRMVSEYHKIPHIAILNGYITNYYDDIRPIPYTHKAYNYQFKLKEKTWNKILINAERASMRYVHRPIAKHRKKLGLKKKECLLDEFTGDLNLICDNPVLFPQKNIPDNYFEAGAILSNSKEGSKRIKINFANNNKNLIYITSGSSGENISLDFINSEQADEYNFIVTGKIKPPEKENVFYKEFIDFDNLDKKPDLYISHGGNGSIYQALKHKIPMIIIPAFFEQEWNAHRVKKLNLGEVIHPDEIEQKLFDKIDLLLNSEINAKHKSISETLDKANDDLIKDKITSWWTQKNWH